MNSLQTVMKKGLPVLLAVLCAFSFISCQQRGRDPETDTGVFTRNPQETAKETGTVTETDYPQGQTPFETAAPDTQGEVQTSDTQSFSPGSATTADTNRTQSGEINAPAGTTPSAATQAQMATQAPIVTQKPTATKAPVSSGTSKPTPKPTSEPTPKQTPGATQNDDSAGTGGTAVSPKDPIGSEVILDSKVPQSVKTAYDTLKKGFSKENISGTGKKTVRFSPNISEETLMNAIYYVGHYNPQLFYVDWNHVSYSYSSNGQITGVTLYCTDAVKQVGAVEAVAERIIKEANQKPTLFERELYVHDWLVQNIQYDKSTENAANIYGALVEGKALCEGYSRAFQYLMNKLGVETVLISGSAGENHMWNMIQLHGAYYFVDVTHDDPTPDVLLAKGEEYRISHACMNITTKLLERTHKIAPKNSYDSHGFLQNADLQTCTATTYHYYTVKRQAVSNNSELKHVLYAQKALQTAEVFFTGAMPTPEELKQTIAAFLKEAYPNKGYSYQYTSPDSNNYKRNTVRITWTIR